MIFKQIDEIVTGKKVMTRRIVKEGEHLSDDSLRVFTYQVYGYRALDGMGQPGYFNGHRERIKWQVGRTYAVVPGRGKPGVWWNPKTQQASAGDVWMRQAAGIAYRPDNMGGAIEGWRPLRIRITAIRREALGDLTLSDALAEGITYDGDCYRSVVDQPGDCISDSLTAYRRLWESVNGPKSWRYETPVWVLTFEVVQP